MAKIKYIKSIMMECRKKICPIETEFDRIPITADILKRNGWKTQNGKYFFLSFSTGFVAYLGIDLKGKSENGKFYVDIDGRNIAEVEYYHELQLLLLGLGLYHN